MDRSNSMIGEKEDVLSRCRERKRFVKLAIDNRYALATAHVAYIQSLRRMSIGLRRFDEHEMMVGSSFSSSPRGVSEPPVVLPGKSPSPSPFPSSSPSPSPPQSPRSERAESRSPLDSLSSHDSVSPASYASPLRMNYMRSRGMQPMTFKDQPPPSPESGRVESYSTTPRYGMDPGPSIPISPSSSHKSVPLPPQSLATGSFSWDFFNVFTPFEDPYHFPVDTGMSQPSDGDSVDLKHVRDEEGIPDLEDGDQGEEYIHDETNEVDHLEENTSKASFIDSDKKRSETANQRNTDTGFFVEKHVPVSRADGITSKASFIDSDKKRSETANKRDTDTGFFGEKHVPVSRADGITQGRTEPSVETMAQPIRQDVAEEINSRYTEKGNAAITKMAAEEVNALVKDKQLADKETPLEKENSTEFVASRDRSFLGSLKNIEDQFIKACDSGKEVSRMLEANKVHYYSSFTEKKGRSWKFRTFFPCGLPCCKEPAVLESHEPPSKALTVITLHRSTSSQSSSSKTPLASSSKDDIDDSISDFVEDFCMISGSHSLTLERLYAWEIKLYEEVKAGDSIRRVYEKKCLQLRHQETKGESFEAIDKTRVAIKDLHSRVRVAIEAVDSVSKRIQRLRDEELEPQLMELTQGFMKMWRIMLGCHQSQYQIIMKTHISGHFVANVVLNESHRQAILHLEKELQNWQLCFMDWMSAQKAYVTALHGWLLKCIKLPETSTRGRSVPFSPHKAGAPLVVIICTDWGKVFEDSKDEVVEAMKSLVGNLRGIWARWDENQNKKKNAESLGNDLDRKVKSIQRMESRMLDTQGPPVDKQKSNSLRAGNPIADGKNLSDSFRKQEEEKVVYQSYLKSLQEGLKDIFFALNKFAEESRDAYQRLVVNSGTACFPYENGRR